MSEKEFRAIVRQVADRKRRTSFPPTAEGKGNNATAERHAEYGAARH